MLYALNSCCMSTLPQYYWKIKQNEVYRPPKVSILGDKLASEFL